MSALAAVQSLVVMLLWLYVGRVKLARWIDDPTAADMEPIGGGEFRQKPAHKYRQMVAMAAYWLPAICCFWLAMLQLLPKEPNPAAHTNQPTHDAADSRESWATWVTPQDSAGNESLSVFVVDPFADTHNAGSDAQPDQRLSQRGVIAHGHDGDQDRSRDEWQGPVPLVRSNGFLNVHEQLPVVLQANDVRRTARPTGMWLLVAIFVLALLCHRTRRATARNRRRWRDAPPPPFTTERGD